MTRRIVLRIACAPLIAFYAWARLRNEEYWDPLDDLNLAIHEAGHVLFQLTGEPGLTLGGSLFQVLVPLVFVGYFWYSKQRFAAAVVMSWVAVNLLNVSLYIGDATRQELPLLGGENSVHDWWFLLTEWDLIDRTAEIARAVRAMGATAFATAGAGVIVWGRETGDGRRGVTVASPSCRPAGGRARRRGRG